METLNEDEEYKGFSCGFGCAPEDHGAIEESPGTWIVRCPVHGDVVEVNGYPRACLSCDGGVF